MNDPDTRQEIDLLKEEHRQLDARIAGLLDDPAADQLEIARMKRRKLALKDRIQALLDQSVPDIIA